MLGEGREKESLKGERYTLNITIYTATIQYKILQEEYQIDISTKVCLDLLFEIF